MLPPRPFALAVATCAAASLAGQSGVPGEPASVQAAAELARHAALDMHAALNACGSRRARRLLARAARRLSYSYALTARLLTDHVPAGATAGAIFMQAASQVAHDTAALAAGSDGHLQARALRVLRRTSRLQEDVALEVSTTRSAGSIGDLIEALSAALGAQDALLSALDGAVGRDRIPSGRRRALQVRGARADAARDALRVALAGARRAVQDPAQEIATGDRPAGDDVAQPDALSENRPTTHTGRDDRPDLS